MPDLIPGVENPINVPFSLPLRNPLCFRVEASIASEVICSLLPLQDRHCAPDCLPGFYQGAARCYLDFMVRHMSVALYIFSNTLYHFLIFCCALMPSLSIIMEGDISAIALMEVMMSKIRPYFMDIVVAAIFILLPGIRGYSNWQIHEYALLFLIYGYIIYLHHKKTITQ
jgi:hypothetical protein